MVRYWKSYKVFLSGRLMKLIMYVLYPLFAVVWCSLMIAAIGSTTADATYGLLITSSMVLSAELLLDTFVYGGIMTKDTNKLEYLKTSIRGMKVLRRSLFVDKLRRIVTAILIFAIVYGLYNEQVSIGQLLSLIFVTGALTELGLLVTRHFTMVSWTMVAIIVANILGAITGMLAVHLSPVYVIVFFMLFGVAVLISNKLIMKKAEGSFYDVGVEKVH